MVGRLDSSRFNPLRDRSGDIICLDAQGPISTDNALFRHKDIEELRDEDEEDPSSWEAGQARPQLRQARWQHSAAWSTAPAFAIGDHGHHQLYGSARPIFLDVGAGATRERGDDGVQADSVRIRMSKDPGHIFGRHHALRRDRRGRGRCGAEVSLARSSSWCASKAPMSNSARDHGRFWPAHSQCRQSGGCRPEDRQGRQGGCVMAVLVHSKYQGSSARASPAPRARSIRNRRWPTAPRWSAASPPVRRHAPYHLPVFNNRRRSGACHRGRCSA